MVGLPLMDTAALEGFRANTRVGFFQAVGQELANGHGLTFITLRAMSRELQAKPDLRRELYAGLRDLAADLPPVELGNLTAMLMTLAQAAIDAHTLQRRMVETFPATLPIDAGTAQRSGPASTWSAS